MAMEKNFDVKKIIETKKAPVAIGPYSQAVLTGNLIFCSGQIGVNPKTNIIAKGIKAQTQQALKNLRVVLASANSSLDCVVKVDVFLKNIDDFNAMNETYANFFHSDPPARQTVEVSALPRNANIEISCIAYSKK